MFPRSMNGRLRREDQNEVILEVASRLRSRSRLVGHVIAIVIALSTGGVAGYGIRDQQPVQQVPAAASPGHIDPKEVFELKGQVAGLIQQVTSIDQTVKQLADVLLKRP